MKKPITLTYLLTYRAGARAGDGAGGGAAPSRGLAEIGAEAGPAPAGADTAAGRGTEEPRPTQGHDRQAAGEEQAVQATSRGGRTLTFIHSYIHRSVHHDSRSTARRSGPSAKADICLKLQERKVTLHPRAGLCSYGKTFARLFNSRLLK